MHTKHETIVGQYSDVGSTVSSRSYYCWSPPRVLTAVSLLQFAAQKRSQIYCLWSVSVNQVVKTDRWAGVRAGGREPQHTLSQPGEQTQPATKLQPKAPKSASIKLNNLALRVSGSFWFCSHWHNQQCLAGTVFLKPKQHILNWN